MIKKLKELEINNCKKLFEFREEIKLSGEVYLDKNWKNFDEYNRLNNWWNDLFN
jgi:hypothetical protein